MPHVLVEIMHLPQPMKGVPYLDENQERKLAKVGDRFELRYGSAQALARLGIGKIVGTSKRQAAAIKARKEAELTEARDEVERLEAKLEKARKKKAKGKGKPGK
jgi:hypothetical protein